MNVGIIGSGEVAQSLAKGFLARGDAVVLGTRDPAKLADFVAANTGSRAASTAEAAAFGELIVVATSGVATVAVLGGIERAAFAKKVVIDATNLVAEDAGGFRLATGSEDSMGERVQRAVPQARVVKAFNTVGAAEMVHPKYAGGPPTMFVAGDDADAKATVRSILNDFGWGMCRHWRDRIGALSRRRCAYGMADVW